MRAIRCEFIPSTISQDAKLFNLESQSPQEEQGIWQPGLKLFNIASYVALFRLILACGKEINYSSSGHNSAHGNCLATKSADPASIA